MKRAVLIASMLLGGCTLIDQNTFDPHAGDAPKLPEAPKPVVVPTPSGPPPLLAIAPNAKPADYTAILRKAVKDAQARKPDVLFDVVEMEAPDVAPGVVLGAAAADIGRALVLDGVPPSRIRLVARPDASAVAREVRVYVR